MADAIWNLKSVGKHIHLPFQSGSNRILKLMNRKYDKEEYIKNQNIFEEEIILNEKIEKSEP